MTRFVTLNTGDRVADNFVLTECNLRKTAAGKAFLSVTLSDGFDTLSGNIWNYATAGSLPACGAIYDVVGTIGEYQGKKQITPTAMRLSENQDMSAFALHYCTDAEGKELWDAIQDVIGSIHHPLLRQIVGTVYSTYEKELFVATSAKAIHHVGIYGNLAHTLEVTDIVDSLCSFYHVLHNTVPISRDLAVAGALLHDIGKSHVYKMDGPAVSYTETGMLFEHIAEGISMLMSVRSSFDSKADGCFALLSHIILSHHGKQEYGSPVTPKFAEAYLVNMADGISATLNTLVGANDKAMAEGKDVTDAVWALDNKQNMLQKNVAEILDAFYEE